MAPARPFTDLMVKSEIKVLTQLHGILEREPIRDRSQFGDLMNAAFERGRLDARVLADELGYNISAVYRWIEGRSAPHKSLWPRIVQWITSAIEQRIADHGDCL